MRDADVVGRGQALGQLQSQVHRFLDGDGAAIETRAQVFTLGEFHHQEARVAVLVEAVDAGDVRVLE